MFTYQVEPWDTYLQDAPPLWALHGTDIGMPMDVDTAQYAQHAADGALQIVTARLQGMLIGYHLSVLRPHIHDRQTLWAFTMLYFVDPQARGRGVGTALFTLAHAGWDARGVVHGLTGTKAGKGYEAMVQRLDYEKVETQWRRTRRQEGT